MSGGQSGIEPRPVLRRSDAAGRNWMPVAEGDKLSTEVQKLLVSVLPSRARKARCHRASRHCCCHAENGRVRHRAAPWGRPRSPGGSLSAPPFVAPLAYLEDRRVVSGRAFRAAVPRAVVVSSVVVVLAVRLVVLAVVGDQVGEGEPVMRGDEIDAGVGRRPVRSYRSELPVNR